MFLDEKTLLEIWLNPGLNLTIFQGTGPRGTGLSSGGSYDVCFNVTLLEGALLVYCMTAQMMTPTLIFITLVDKFNNTLNDEICLTTVKFNFESFSTL